MKQWPSEHYQKIILQMVKRCRSLGLIILELNDSSILCKSMIRNQVTWTPKILRPRDDMSMCACFCGQYARRGILEASHWELGPRARANKGANAGETGVGNQTRVCVRTGSRSKHLLCSLCAYIYSQYQNWVQEKKPRKQPLMLDCLNNFLWTTGGKHRPH